MRGMRYMPGRVNSQAQQHPRGIFFEQDTPRHHEVCSVQLDLEDSFESNKFSYYLIDQTFLLRLVRNIQKGRPIHVMVTKKVDLQSETASVFPNMDGSIASFATIHRALYFLSLFQRQTNFNIRRLRSINSMRACKYTIWALHTCRLPTRRAQLLLHLSVLGPRSGSRCPSLYS